MKSLSGRLVKGNRRGQWEWNLNTFSVVPIIALLLLLLFISGEAQLSTTFYDGTCPNASSIIRSSNRGAISGEAPTIHDCFVQGCDASILLDEAPNIQSEKTAFSNINSARGYDVVERVCPGVVSCADILTLAARDASAAVGGPSWTVRLGRRDSTTASRNAANADLPSPFSPLDVLISAFRDKNLTSHDMVALSGAHTLGQSRCFLFRDRIYGNGSDIDAGFASTRRQGCPQGGGDTNLAALDLVTPNSFDNNYYRNLLERKGLLQSDQVLNSGSTATIVSDYSTNPQLFATDFANAMIKMGDDDDDD